MNTPALTPFETLARDVSLMLRHNTVAPGLNREGVLFHVQRAIEEAGSEKAFADRCGVTPEYVSGLLDGKREIVPAVLRVLKLCAVTVYQRTGS